MKTDRKVPPSNQTGESRRPESAGPPPDGLSRRNLLKLMAASAALALGPGCDRKPYRKIASMAETPEYSRPGIPLYYASTWTDGPLPYGMKIRTLEGRPVKIEGLPGHPLNDGTSSAAMQASILSLYDPDRLRGPKSGGRGIEWAEADRRIVDALKSAESVVLVTRATLGPSERALVRLFLEACPAARHVIHEPVHDAPRRTAWKALFGADGATVPDFARAERILSIDSDFLGTDGDALGAIAGFAAGRRPDGKDRSKSHLSRLYVAESALTVTGSNADHRIPLRPSRALSFVRALTAAIDGNGDALKAFATEEGIDGPVVTALADDLASSPGKSVVVAGPHLPEAVHAAVGLLNDRLGAPGKTLRWNPEPPALPVDPPDTLARALEPDVDVLLTLGVNPVHDTVGQARDLAPLVGKARLSAGHGIQEDETVSACTIALPSCHVLESWNDAAPVPGVSTLCQPVIAPLFDGRQEAESLLVWTKGLLGDDPALKEIGDWHDYVRTRWQKAVLPTGNGDSPRTAWEKALRAGMTGSPGRISLPSIDREAAETLIAGAPPEATGGTDGFEIVLSPHNALHDGRFAMNAWLLELPDPVSRLVWDNAAAVAPATARRLGLAEGDRVTLASGDRSIEIPVLIQPGTHENVVALTLGHGRTRPAAGVGVGQGVNTAPLVGARSVTLKAAGGKKTVLARTQETFDMHGRPIVIDGSAATYAADPHFVEHRQIHAPKDVQIHDEFDYSKGHHWGMAIDLTACVGCSSCVIACQAENNIPVVGKEECRLGREMHWMRIDRYETGDEANPRVLQQPMLCQQCDNAPCENVCPVNATAHSTEGLNEQVYNRCVGTRYCANNCPYKVRRFNFYNYTGRVYRDPVQELMSNPNVTVRERGVMEKCTFCVQRINEVKFRAKNEGKTIPDGAIKPACVEACPAGAIHFGDLNDPDSAVARLRKSHLAYPLLGQLNTRPSVSYLARIRNPHPSIPEPKTGGGSHGHGHGDGKSHGGGHGADGGHNGDHGDGGRGEKGGHR